MRYGISGFAWTSKMENRHLGLLGKVREDGFSAFEVPMFEPRALPVAGLRRAFAESGLECTVCAILPEGINPISPEKAVRERSVEHLRACIETAAEMGATLLGGPVYAPIGYLPEHRPTGDEFGWAVEGIQALGETLDGCGMTLSIEPVNRSETFFVRTLAEAGALVDAIGHPRVGMTVDTFHANIEEKGIAAAMEGIGGRLRHVHASENDRGLLGTGHVDFPGIMGALDRMRYEGCVVIEGFGYSAEETHGPGVLWADKSVSPEELGRKGLAYLKGLARG